MGWRARPVLRSVSGDLTRQLNLAMIAIQLGFGLRTGGSAFKGEQQANGLPLEEVTQR